MDSKKGGRENLVDVFKGCLRLEVHDKLPIDIDAPTDEQLEANEELENRLADYCIGRNVIYVAFAWSMADEEAYKC